MANSGIVLTNKFLDREYKINFKQLQLKEKQLLAFNNRLAAFNQKLNASNQQLLAVRQQLEVEEEFNLIKEHPGKGEEICKNLRLDPRVRSIIRHHHEKIDGSGYPDGLKGDEISKIIRIVTIADIFDAVTTNRPYHAVKSTGEAMAILTQEAKEGKLDAAIVKKFMEYFNPAVLFEAAF